jgi:hypothetical protein
MDEVKEKKTVSVFYTTSSKPYSVELLTLGCYRNNFVLLNTCNKVWLLFQVVKLKWVKFLEGHSQKRSSEDSIFYVWMQWSHWEAKLATFLTRHSWMIVFPSNMIGTLGSGTAMVPSESTVEVEDSGHVDSEWNVTSDDSEVSQPSPSTPPETQWQNSLRFLASSRLPAVSSRLISRFYERGVEFFPGFSMEIKRPCFHADSIYCMWKTALNTLVREV